MSILSEAAYFQELGTLHPAWNWYAIADSAQSPDLPDALIEAEALVNCFFDAGQGSPLARKSPHLVQITHPDPIRPSWKWILANAKKKPSVTIIASHFSYDELFDRLKKFSEVALPDGETMFFAFWDPIVLGGLVGQKDDLTLHVTGPILSKSQRHAFLGKIDGWWYWDRAGSCQTVSVEDVTDESLIFPIVLTQLQVDDLVESSIPDHILYYIDLNQPFLLKDLSSSEAYEFVRCALDAARNIGLDGMQDLVNYVCVNLIYRDQIFSAEIAEILLGVKNNKISFSAAMSKMP